MPQQQYRKLLLHVQVLLIPLGHRGYLGVTLVAAYLVFWHGQHLAALLPILLVLACPLAHLLMHGGHHNHSHPDQEQRKPNAQLEE